jgi:hypothetical protein
MKKIKLFLMMTFCVFSFLTAEARRVDVEKAEKVARSYARATPRLTARRDFRLSKTVSRRVDRPRPATRNAEPQDEPMFYVFTMNGNSGFILVAGDDVAKPVLGYSDAGTYDDNNPHLAYWMGTLSQEIADAIENSVSQDEQIKAAWDAFAADNDVPLQSAGDYVAPLIRTKWDQSSPYNDLCPKISGERAPAGCVATTMAQIMKYHEYPTTRTVTIPGYTTPDGLTVNPVSGSTTYKWSDMSNTYSSSSTSASKAAVAELIYHCGVSVEMYYNEEWSSAMDLYAATALKTCFGYDAGISYLYRSYYSYTEWIGMIKTELKSSRPIYYCGDSDDGGHAFVCDGYDANGLFHFNWGWGGASDGYFEVSALNPEHVGIGGNADGYNQSQAIIIGIQPDSGGQHVMRLGLTTLYTNKSSLKDLTESFNVSATELANLGVEDIEKAYIGVMLCRQDDSYYEHKTVLVNIDLPVNNMYTSSRIISGYSLPSNLAVGTYKLYPAFSAASGKPSIIPGENGNQYILVEVKADGSVTLRASSDMPNLSLIPSSLKAVRNIYQNKSGNFTAEIKNDGTADYNSKLTLKLGNQTVTTDPVVIPAGTTKTVGFSDTVTLNPGNYPLSVWYDPDNSPYGDPSEQLGSSVEIEVKATPTEAPRLSLASTPSFPNKNAVDINNPDLTVVIKNTGGLFEGEIIVFIFPENGGQSITYFGITNVWLEKNETQSIRFNDPVNDLRVGVRYRYRVYYYKDNDWEEIGDADYFTAADPSTVNAQTPRITAHPQTVVYDIGATATALSVTANAGDGGVLSYQWYRNTTNSNTGGTAINGATAARYTPPTDALGTVYYYVTVTNTNAAATGQKTAAITSNAASVTVQKISPPALAAPTLADKTAVSVTLNTVDGNVEVEYSRDGKNWQTSPTFDNLTPDTDYTFYVRTKETATHNASPASPGLTVRTYAGTEAELVSLFVNGTRFVAGDAKELNYQATCGETSVKLDNITYSKAASASVTVGNVEYWNQLIPLSEDATIVINIRIVSGDKRKTNDYTLTIANPLDANEVLFKRWDDVVAVNSNPANNGNHHNIEGVRWNVGGRQSEEWYIQISNSENYSVEINHAGKWHHVCGEPHTLAGKVIAYPNPVTVGDNINLQLPQNFTGGYVDVVSLAGSVTKRKLPLPAATNTISVADWLSGVYLLNIVAPNGDKETIKVIVNN